MRYPAFLPDGGTIAFVAPSFGCSTEPYRSAFDHAKERFAGMGHRTVDGPNAYASSGVGISAAPEACAVEFMDAWQSPDNDVILSCGGGELMCEILDGVGFDVLARTAPKWFMGYSDNTNLTFLLTTLCDTAAIYGPCAPAFGMEPWHASLDDAFALLRGKKLAFSSYPLYETVSLKDEEHPLEPYNVTEPTAVIARRGSTPITESSFSGRLVGGCLDCLVNLAGTRFDRAAAFAEKYKDDGIIWFLEACDLNVFGIRRALWHLKHAGWFSHVNGFLIGRPLTGMETMMDLDHIEAVMAVLKEFDVPVVLDADIGHLPPMMPLVSGALAEVTLRERHPGAPDKAGATDTSGAPDKAGASGEAGGGLMLTVSQKLG